MNDEIRPGDSAGIAGPGPGHAEDLLKAEEWHGTRLALSGKGLLIVVMTIYSLFVFGIPSVFWPLIFSALFTATLAVQVWVAVRRPQWMTLRLVIIAVDSIALAVAISSPNPFSGFNLPEQQPFRDGFFAVIIVYIVSVGYTYKPRIALTAGITCAAAWAYQSYRVYWQPDTVTWADMPPSPTRGDVIAMYGHPNFFDIAGRNAEIIFMVLTALLVAGLVKRSRAQVTRLLRAEAGREQARAERQFIRETFGKYVPDAVAAAIVADRGRLIPEKRVATVLFVDIAGFTALGERVDADRLLRILNAYFDAAGRIITANGGTINQFQGDAILASFNVPVIDDDHACNALAAAQELLEMVDSTDFEGERIDVRIGVHTGELAAGAVGSSDRLSYTVHGNCVNVAARLEQMNKTLGTRVLFSDATYETAVDRFRCRSLGAHEIRGNAGALDLYTFDTEAKHDD